MIDLREYKTTVTTWYYSELPPQERRKLERVFRNLRDTDESTQGNWPYFESYQDLHRIYGPGKSTCRIFCCLHAGAPPIIVLLCGCYGKPPKPSNAYRTAKARSREIDLGEVCTNEFNVGEME